MHKSEYRLKTPIPDYPAISDREFSQLGLRDTLDRVAQVIELLNQLDLSEGLSPAAERGLYWIHSMLIDSVRYVSEALRDDD